MSFPESLLTELAKEKQLSERETDVFLALFCQGKTRREIAERLHVQETTVSTCLSGVYKKFGISGRGPVKESSLKDELKRREGLWQKQQPATSPSTTSPKRSSIGSDDLIAQVREHCRQKILSLHGRMRLLSGEEIGVDQLYVDVWLLHRSPRTYQVSESKLLETFDLRNDRLGLGDRIKRNPGFEIADASTKLLILGKPGAGKTTFLKHLAVDWCKGQFQPGLIAVFIELRDIRDRRWKLIDAIRQELGLETLEQTEALLKQGKLLVLMDGLDEVPTNELRRKVQNQLQKKISDTHANNRWILTCRTQIIEVIPNGFTPVEVAEFSPKQAQQFFKKWFQASGQSDAEVLQQWEDFDSTASRNPALKELTVTPILLSLVCLVLHDEGEMPSQLTDLYKRGIRLLLEKWNNAKAIIGWEMGIDIYRALSVEQKEALLIKIAARKFENPKNFVLFQQDELADQVVKFLNLTNRREGVAVLKAIEAQHGLLIARADELWSFSHLTFQEHFTVQWLTQLSPEQLANKIANTQWQQVIEQLVKSQQPANRLLCLIKQSIDWSISSEPALNQFLTWVLQKAGSIWTNDKPAALRAFYFALERDLESDRARDLALDRDRSLARALDIALARALDLDRDLAFNLDLDLTLARALVLACACPLTHDLARVRVQDFACVLNLVRNLVFSQQKDDR
jgi:predicted NACHT family NTPase/DNA-binding CsgD family transcriptional regulator